MKSVKCPSCGFTNFASTSNCKKCNKSFPPNADYKSIFRGNLVWRDGDNLVMNLDASLPDTCIMCNAPANGRRFPLKLTWDQKLWKTPLLVGYAVISYKELSLSVGMCDSHFKRNDLRVFFGVITMILGFVMFLGTLYLDARYIKNHLDTYVLLSGLAFGFLIIFIGAVLFSYTPIKINAARESYFWIKGVCPTFLSRLPGWSNDNLKNS
jgi:hypothetical protein